MKTSLVSLWVLLAFPPQPRAQGTVNFSNIASASGINAPVTDWDGTRLTSPNFSAGLVVDDGGALTFVAGSITRFRAGAAAGYVFPNIVAIPGHDIGTSVILEMVAFEGTTDADALAASHVNEGLGLGVSNPVTVTLGGGGVSPPDLVGLQSFRIPLVIPEPSTIALGFAGATMLFIVGKRRSSSKTS